MQLIYHNPKTVGVLVCILFLSISGYITLKEYQLRVATIEQQISTELNRLSDQIETSLSDATGAIKSLAHFSQNYQIENNFESAGETIIESHPSVSVVQILDSGKIIATYPLKGNEVVIGYDILKDEKTKEEALEAIERRGVYFAGPINLKQGGSGIVGRLPIFSEEDSTFKGFAAGIIYLDKLLDSSFLVPKVPNTQLQIKKIDSGKEGLDSIFFQSESEFKNPAGISKSKFIPNANWEISLTQIEPIMLWNLTPVILLRIISAGLFGFLAYSFVRQPALLSKRIEEQSQELLAANKRYEYATRATSDVIWDWDFITGKVLRSQSFEQHFGFSPDEQKKDVNFWNNLIHPEDRPEILNNLTKTLESDAKYWKAEFRVKDKSGKYHYIVDSGYILRDEKGKAIRMIGAIQEITERKMAELALASEKERLIRVIEGTEAGTWEWNVQTGETIFNEEWARILGYKLHELEPISIKTWESLMHPDDLPIAQKDLEDHFSGKTSFYQTEIRLRHKEGHWVWILGRGRVMSRTEDGEPLWMFGTQIDISEKKAKEEALERLNERLQSTNSELKVFASVASHDMREPLRMISSFLSLIQKRYSEKLDEKGNQYIDFAVDGAKRLSRLIEDLLEYSRIGFDSKNKESVDTNEIIEAIIDINKQSIKTKGAQIKAENLPVIKAVRVPIQQLFHNLITNSLKFAQENMDPIIAIKCKEFENFWQFTVEDNGIGIDEKDHDIVFGVMKRLHSKDKYDGTGIGLAICKKIVNQHGGEIWVESEIGVGTKFFFTIEKT
ncbi:PAS domain-containing protein [Algoriphagus formosus]